MNDEKKGDKKVETIPPVVEKTEPSQSLIQKELEKVKTPRSKSAQIEYNINRMKKDLEKAQEEEGIIPEPLDEEDENKPVTVGMLKQRDVQSAQRTALTMANDIEDSDERELTKHYLQTRIVPSGNPTEDLRLARSLVNSIKNQQIVEEVGRKDGVKAKTIPSSSGGPAKLPEDQFVPTQEEASMMRAPFNLSKEDIIRVRTEASR